MRISTFVLVLAMSGSMWVHAGAIERKQPKDVDINSLTTETQRTIYEGGVHMAWWIPVEYWEASLAKDEKVTEEGRKQVLDALRGYSMVVIVQADVGALGKFTFYDQDAISKGLKIEFNDGKAWSPVTPLAKVPDDLAPLLAMFGPILGSAMGPLGNSLYFFVLDDHKKGGRVISPYDPGALRITLADKKGASLAPQLIEFPLDSLYVPRRCPNGKPAHVSWVVCPWDGSKLPL